MGTGEREGLIFVLTGSGKGKTSAALGMALRAAGQGLRVLILQFMKGLTAIGERKALANTGLPITIKRFGRPGFVHNRVCEALDLHIAHQGLEAFEDAMASRSYDLVVLDEINVAVDFGLLKIEQVIQAIAKKPPELHLVLTGRHAREELIEIADLVTEMREVKHHYNKGIKAQKGIEF
jgi:cob(I)alamin adenosyltransferase